MDKYIGVRFVIGAAAIAIGLYMMFRNRSVADLGITFQRSIESGFTGQKTLWLFRLSAVIGGAIAIWCGILIVMGRS